MSVNSPKKKNKVAQNSFSRKKVIQTIPVVTPKQKAHSGFTPKPEHLQMNAYDASETQLPKISQV